MAEGLCAYGAIAADAFACTSRATPFGIAPGVAKSSQTDPNDYRYISRRQTTTPEPVMFVRAYLRASTDDQDATRARETLRTFAAEHGTRIAATYVENASDTLLDRRELLRLLADAEPGDVLLVEAVDRLSRLDRATWDQLRDRIARAGLQVVSLDLPLTHALIQPAAAGGDGLQEWMTRALSQMFLEFMAAFARKDYETRRARAAQGIARAKAAGVYKGRPRDEQLHSRICECLARGMSVRGTARLLECSTSTVNRCRATQVSAL